MFNYLKALRKCTLCSYYIIDDNKTKQGTILNYLEVFSFNKIEDLIRKQEAKVYSCYPVPSYKLRTQILKN